MSYGSYQIVVGRVSNIRRASSRGWMKFSFGDPPVDIHMAKDGRPGFNNGEPIAVTFGERLSPNTTRHGGGEQDEFS
jgi:hypothetical protein